MKHSNLGRWSVCGPCALGAMRVRGRLHCRRVEEAARCGANLMPRILEAVETYATVGEISDAMRQVFGEYKESVVV